MSEVVNTKQVDKAHLPQEILKVLSPSDFELLDQYFSFGFVRDPYARAISAYNEIRPEIYKRWVEGELKTEHYRSRLNIYLQYLSPQLIRGWHFPFRHFITQSSLFVYQNKQRCNSIFKVEEMASVPARLSQVNEQLGKAANSWPDIRKNERPVALPPQDLLFGKTVRLINLLYEDDFERFAYALL